MAWADTLKKAAERQAAGQPAFAEKDEQDAADWSSCAIGERYAMDRHTREAIVNAWTNDPLGLSTAEVVDAVLSAPWAEDEAMHQAQGDAFTAMALLGVAFSHAVGDGEVERAKAIFASIERFAPKVPPVVVA